MANGKPGDHFATDVLNHGLTVFSPEVDRPYVECVRLSGTAERAQLDQTVRRLAGDVMPASGYSWSPAVLERLAVELRSILGARRAEARARGWEVEP